MAPSVARLTLIDAQQPGGGVLVALPSRAGGGSRRRLAAANDPCGKASNRSRAGRLPHRAADDTTVVPGPFPARRRPPDAGPHPPPRAGVVSLEVMRFVHGRKGSLVFTTGRSSGFIGINRAQQKGLFWFVSEDPYAEVCERRPTWNVHPTFRVGGVHPDPRNHDRHEPPTVLVTRRSSTQGPGSARCGDPDPRCWASRFPRSPSPRERREARTWRGQPSLPAMA